MHNNAGNNGNNAGNSNAGNSDINHCNLHKDNYSAKFFYMFVKYSVFKERL